MFFPIRRKIYCCETDHTIIILNQLIESIYKYCPLLIR